MENGRKKWHSSLFLFKYILIPFCIQCERKPSFCNNSTVPFLLFFSFYFIIILFLLLRRRNGRYLRWTIFVYAFFMFNFFFHSSIPTSKCDTLSTHLKTHCNVCVVRFVMFFFLSVFYIKTGIANKLCSFDVWSKWYSSVQNDENIKSFETFKGHG